MLFAAQKMLGYVNGQNVFEQFTVISLQMLHILLFLCEEEKQRRKPRKWRAEKKNISVKLKYQFISLPKRKVKAPEQKAQDSKHISIARKKGKAGKGKMFFNARLCGWKCNCALILMKWLMRWKFSQSLSRISSEESFQITDSVSKREKRRHEWRKMATNFPTTEF